MKRIVLTGGGTAGHVTPNLALIPTLQKEGWEIHYIGTADGIERRLVEALEGGELTLEESFSAYERGARLSAYLKGLLDQGERRIAALTESLKEIDISGEVEE